jgi:hypothetical protein
MENITFWIMSSLFTIVSFSLSFWIKNLTGKLDCSEAKIHANELEITKLKEKLWSKQELKEAIEESVEVVFLRYENTQIKQSNKGR